jgi:hypothetical protein
MVRVSDVDVNSVPGLLHSVVVGDVADVSEVHDASISRGAACTSETSATLPTTIQCNNPRTDLTSIIKHRESLKSAISNVWDKVR